jgi:hypothetical protein
MKSLLVRVIHVVIRSFLAMPFLGEKLTALKVSDDYHALLAGRRHHSFW